MANTLSDTIVSFDSVDLVSGASIFGVQLWVTLHGGAKTTIMAAPEAVPSLIALARKLSEMPQFAPPKGAA